MMQLKRGSLEPHVFEIWSDGVLVEEIEIFFSLKKIPSFFESVEQIKKWLKELEKKMARQSAYGSLALKNHSSEGLKKKLHSKGFSESVSQELIDELIGQGLIQDEEFIERLIEKELASLHGPRYIEAKLNSLGLKTDQVRKIVTKERQQEAISKLLKKIKKNHQAALQRRGFDWDCIQKVVIPLVIQESAFRRD
jgi:SOS response regulatory protein OraA/RecX